MSGPGSQRPGPGALTECHSLGPAPADPGSAQCGPRAAGCLTNTFNIEGPEIREVKKSDVPKALPRGFTANQGPQCPGARHPPVRGRRSGLRYPAGSGAFGQQSGHAARGNHPGPGKKAAHRPESGARRRNAEFAIRPPAASATPGPRRPSAGSSRRQAQCDVRAHGPSRVHLACFAFMHLRSTMLMRVWYPLP